MVHPIIVGYQGELDIFKQSCGNLWDLVLGEECLGAGKLVRGCSRCSPVKGGNSFKALLILVMSVLD
jgi:hypothetical protein